VPLAEVDAALLALAVPPPAPPTPGSDEQPATSTAVASKARVMWSK
jgi:hypothetical protein